MSTSTNSGSGGVESKTLTMERAPAPAPAPAPTSQPQQQTVDLNELKVNLETLESKYNKHILVVQKRKDAIQAAKDLWQIDHSKGYELLQELDKARTQFLLLHLNHRNQQLKESQSKIDELSSQVAEFRATQSSPVVSPTKVKKSPPVKSRTTIEVVPE